MEVCQDLVRDSSRRSTGTNCCHRHIQHRLTLCSLVSVDTCCLTSAFSTDSHCAVWSASTRVASPAHSAPTHTVQSGQCRHVLPHRLIQHRLTLCSLVSVDTCCLTSNSFSTDSHCAVWSASTRVASHSWSSTPSPSLVDMPAVSVRSLRTFSSGLSQVAFSDVNADELGKLGRPTECSSVYSQSVKRVTNSLHCPH